MPVSFVPSGEDAFGFSTMLDKHVQDIPPSTPISTFLQTTTTAVTSPYIEQINFDSTQAKFFDLFNANIEAENSKQGQSMSQHKYRQTSYKMDEEELKLFKKNGFVVSERMGASSFAEVFYHLYSDDLPVFVSSDSILHAWHHTYDKVLEEIEKKALIYCLEGILTGMSKGVVEAHNHTKGTVLEVCVLDADYFISVALSLLQGGIVECQLNQGERVKDTLVAVEAESLKEFELFGRQRTVDFSLFKPRGHYTNSDTLKKYFKAMTWCGTIDLRVAGPKDQVSTRELGSSVVLHSLLHSSPNLVKAWVDFDEFLQKFIGLTDSMTFAQLGDVLKAAKITSLTAIKQESDLVALQEHVIAMDAGKQNICGHFYYASSSNAPTVLPRTFTFMGQKFTVDSWVTSNITYDRVSDENGRKLQRRIPTALDVAYTVFNNDHVAPELARMMQDTTNDGVKFRDGLPYHNRLLAIRKVIESIPSDMWTSSIYFQWLATLRTLSFSPDEIRGSTTIYDVAITQQQQQLQQITQQQEEGKKEEKKSSFLPDFIANLLPGGKDKDSAPTAHLPQAACTSAWQDRITNTQCASWTQLRHDTILYVKQSASFSTCCEYPAGYVEPNPVFWRQFLKMVKITIKFLEDLKFPEIVTEEEPFPGYKHKTSNKNLTEYMLRIYQQFVLVLEKLVSISEKQANNQPLTDDMNSIDRKGIAFGARLTGPIDKMSEVRFLKNVIEASHGSGATNYLGWYPQLFYGERKDSGRWDPIIADVHTDMPDSVAGDPGCVLHEAVGNINTMFVAVDRGDSTVCYAGPVLSHYEFTCPLNERKNDGEWRDMLRKNPPPHPRWTQSFLVPGTNPKAAEYKHKEEGGKSNPY